MVRCEAKIGFNAIGALLMCQSKCAQCVVDCANRSAAVTQHDWPTEFAAGDHGASLSVPADVTGHVAWVESVTTPTMSRKEAALESNKFTLVLPNRTGRLDGSRFDSPRPVPNANLRRLQGDR